MARPTRRSILRRLYPVSVEIGFITALLIVIGAFRLDYSSSDTFEYVPENPDAVLLVPIPPTNIAPKPPPPPMPQIPVEVANDEVLDDEIIPIGDEINPDNLDPYTPPVPPIDPGSDEIVFIPVEDYPGVKDGLADIMSRLRYPEIARKAGIEGRVTIEFVIEKDGSVSNAVVLKGIGGGCDEAALKAVQETQFIPGMQRKKPVRVRMSLPIVFRLSN